ncbi:MAG: Ig-like domain-containing protein [Pseudomonadota bacterium]|nr:Ig-like domain-containing protein [Pseudomonadota bacterium]
MLLFLLACAEPPPVVAADTLPDPGDYVLAGPGGPAASFDAAQLDQPCAALTGGPEDIEHHNLVGIYDGWLVLPWAPEDGGGGISLFDFSDPCAPAKIGEAYSAIMRESHTLAIAEVDGRTILAVDAHHDGDRGGIGFWDLTDPTAPVWLSDLELPGYHYPDAYFRVALSTFWQGDVLYVSAGFLGVFTVDVSDPAAPVLLDQWTEAGFLAGSFHVIGNLALASSAGLSRTMLWDIGDPTDWQLLADWEPTDDGGEPRPYYFANVGGRYAFFARKGDGGGPMVYDLADPTVLTRVSSAFSPEGDGGYVSRHHDTLFQGESNFGARYDFSDPSAPIEIARIDMAGDFDTLTPIGNVAVASVDDDADPGLATQVFPWDPAPDARGPTAELTSPMDGATWVPVTGRIGLSFDESIEPKSAHAGSLRVWRADGAAVPGRFYGQETLVNFVPDAPFDADTTYVVEVPAGGIADVSGNPTEATLRFTFSTGAAVAEVPW